jgi:hypothetical protein
MRVRALVAVAALALAASPARAPAAEHVIHISVDGLSATLLQTLLTTLPGDYPSFARFVAEGATTFAARTDFTHTITLPNHTCMVTGRPVLQPTGQPDTVHHGYVGNVDPPAGVTLHNGGNPQLTYVASAFDVVHDHGLSTAHYASKSKFVLYDRSYDAFRGAPDAVPPDDGTDKIDTYFQSTPGATHAAFLAGMAANRFNYVFLHYSNPDDLGHANGWGSFPWNTAVKVVDGYLADIFALVEGDPVLDGHTLIILSADHGGTGFDHSVATNAANYTIPFFAWGDGVAPGADLYALNPTTRAHPGTGRPSYTASVQPIRNGDGANLALAELGLPPVPGSTIGAAQDLELNASAIPLLPQLARAALFAMLLAGGALALRGRARASARR